MEILKSSLRSVSYIAWSSSQSAHFLWASMPECFSHFKVMCLHTGENKHPQSQFPSGGKSCRNISVIAFVAASFNLYGERSPMGS
jgi:hypothetical protein